MHNKLLTPPEATDLLLEAQCSAPEAVPSILRALVPRLCPPHPTTTAAALELLQIHPHQTTPYIPDLISAAPHHISLAVETFSALLQSDRTLLVPILGALSDMTLSAPHQLQTRHTLNFALSVVDDPDLPTIVRAILRTASKPATWAARALRIGLARPIDPSMLPVLSHVLADAARPFHPVAHALRAAARPPIVWLDLVIWALTLQRDTPASAADVRHAHRTICAAVSGGMLVAPVSTAIVRARPALLALPVGVARLVTSVIAAASPRLEDVVYAVRFAREMLTACPAAGARVAAVLVRGGFVQEAVLCALVAQVNTPVLQVNELHRLPRVCVAAAKATDGGAWGGLFIAIRKGLLFGYRADRERAMALAARVVEVAALGTVKEILGLLHESLDASLGEPLALKFLDLACIALMRGLERACFKPFLERIMPQCPDGLLNLVAPPDEGTTAEERRAARNGALQVDVGMIWDQSRTAIASVIPAAASFILVIHGENNIPSVSVELLNVVVLVPVVCISLYQAVEDLDEAYWGSSHCRSAPVRKGRNGANKHDMLPENIKKISSSDLAAAVSSFGAGMACLVGVLNLSCRSLSVCHRSIENRRAERKLSNEQHNQKAMLSLFERLTEFDRMMNALLLGVDVLHWKLQENKRTKRNIGSSGKASGQSARATISDTQSALDHAQDVKSAILACVYEIESSLARRRGRLTDNKVHDFPMLSLEAIVCSLAALPDEAGIENISDHAVCMLNRDIELVRIDKLVLCHLANFMKEVKVSTLDGVGKADNGASSINDVPVSSPVAPEQDHPPPELSMNELFPNLDEELEKKDDIFFPDDSSQSEEDVEDDQELKRSSLKWAADVPTSLQNEYTYVGKALSSILEHDASPDTKSSFVVTNIIQSAAFTALLLDRAATYVALAREMRRSPHDEKVLQDVTVVSLMAIECLVTILRLIPTYSEKIRLKEEKLSNSGQTCEQYAQAYVAEMGENLIVGVPVDAEGEDRPKIGFDKSSDSIWKVLDTLKWIVVTSVDATVATKAVEAILILSEFAICQTMFGRKIAFLSLTTVYEYEGMTNSNAEEQSILHQDTFGEWSLRRRNANDLQGPDIQAGVLICDDPGPWIDLRPKGSRRNRTLEQHRLMLYFSGMYIPDALIEGCGWVRELSDALTSENGSVGESVGGRKNGSRKDAGKKKGMSNGKRKNGSVTGKKFVACDTLLDMIGLRSIIETLLEVALMGLQWFTVSESLLSEEASNEESSPMPQLCKSLRLFCGVIALFHRNRQALASAYENGLMGNEYMDLDFDHSMVLYCTTILQSTRCRTEEIYAWYSNGGTDVSLLSGSVRKWMEEIIGGTSEAVMQSLRLADCIKTEGARVLQEDGVTEEGERTGLKGGRKEAGYVRTKRKRLAGMKDEEMSKARRGIPRLSKQGELVVKSVEKIGKCMGISKRSGARSWKDMADKKEDLLHFGSGLRGRDEDDEISGAVLNEDEYSDEEAEEEEEECESEGEYGFHTRRKHKEIEKEKVAHTETVTVNFRRHRKQANGAG